MEEQSAFERWIGSMAPGPMLGAILATVKRASLSSHDQVALLKARTRQISYLQAEQAADLVAVADPTGLDLETEDEATYGADEIRAALAWTRRAAEFQLSWARTLIWDFPAVWSALQQGLIDLPKARVIAQCLTGVNPESAAEVADLLLQRAPRQTTGQIRVRARQLVIQVDPAAARLRYQDSLRERRVVADLNPEGTVDLMGLSLPAEQARAAFEHLNRLAQTAPAEGRTIDQIRADIFLALLQGSGIEGLDGNGNRGTVDIRVDLTTLIGLDDHPADIPGWGPVIADVARRAADPQSRWQITVTDPETGLPVWTGPTRRRPSTTQRQTVAAYNQHCVFPGCRMPAADSDLDHIQPWSEGGPTKHDNLTPLCRHDHQLKHHGWKLQR
ncbi:MAG TPA: DUF222 domain-containing protein, partial [Acidimicrobiia bacterium]